MAEMWDIARLVEENPDDYELRWRLAKKLYTAWEYRLALEHLQVLKNEWQRKLNVTRYLAATYYRLGRYDEAAAELCEAIETWPEDLGLREQLARVLEIAGQRLDAAEVWEGILEIDPHHPIAETAARRLRDNTPETPEKELHLGDSDSGIDLSPGRVCPHCGAQNSEEFDRCWQCHAALAGEMVTPAHRVTPPGGSRPGLPVLTPETVSLMAGLTVIGLISVSIYLSLNLLLGDSEPGQAREVLRTLWDVYTHELKLTRVLSGLSLVIIWPLSLWAVLLLVKPERPVPAALVNLTGLLLGSLAFLTSWLPPQMLLLAPVFPVLVALAIILGSFGIGVIRAVNVWALHLALVLLSMMVLFTAFESYQLGAFFNPISEVPAVVRYERRQMNAEHPGEYTLPGTEIPLTQEVIWQTTGSAWLDRRAGETEFTVYCENEAAGLRFEINQGETQPRVYERVIGKQWAVRYPMAPGEAYTVRVHGPDGVKVRVVISGLLIPKFR
jgi:hypothetical protein